MAEPGEFTKRAFLNGRIDLAQAEAVMDLIQSKTDTAAKSSMEQLEGTLSQWVNQVQEQLLDMLALIEVNVDYPEEDTEEATMDEILPQVEAITLRLEELIKTADTGRVLREGLKTAIIGRPNVGKSSLLNALLRENRAIVTEIPGTTRDLLEEYLNIRGILLRIIDTAGIRNTDDIVEAMGVERSRESIQRADLILYILDVAEELQDEDMSIMKELKDKQCIIVLNKIDKPARVTEEKIRAFFPEKKIVSVSALNREGIDELENEIYQMVFQGRVQSTGHVMVTNTRHKDALERAVRALKESKKSIEMRMPLDCIAIDIRDAWHCLGEITGETVDEDVIDRIFSKFCLGK